MIHGNLDFSVSATISMDGMSLMMGVSRSFASISAVPFEKKVQELSRDLRNDFLSESPEGGGVQCGAAKHTAEHA